MSNEPTLYLTGGTLYIAGDGVVLHKATKIPTAKRAAIQGNIIAKIPPADRPLFLFFLFI